MLFLGNSHLLWLLQGGPMLYGEQNSRRRNTLISKVPRNRARNYKKGDLVVVIHVKRQRVTQLIWTSSKPLNAWMTYMVTSYLTSQKISISQKLSLAVQVPWWSVQLVNTTCCSKSFGFFFFLSHYSPAAPPLSSAWFVGVSTAGSGKCCCWEQCCQSALINYSSPSEQHGGTALFLLVKYT